MEIYRVHADGKEELLASELDRAEVDQLREWFSYTKPLGLTDKIMARQSCEVLFCISSAGAEAEAEPLKEDQRSSRAA